MRPAAKELHLGGGVKQKMGRNVSSLNRVHEVLLTLGGGGSRNTVGWTKHPDSRGGKRGWDSNGYDERAPITNLLRLAKDGERG